MFILTFIRIFLFLVTMLSTYLNISSEFFTGRIETINSVKNLSVEFPVIFKLTFKDLLNETKIKRTHKCVNLYYNGIIPTYEKNTHFRWTDRNCTKTAKETFESILNFQHISDVLSGLKLVQRNRSKEIFTNESLIRLLGDVKPQPVFPDGVFSIDLRDYMRGKEIKQITFNFNMSQINSTSLMLEDAGEVGVRTVLNNVERHTGDRLEHLEKGWVYVFFVKFTEEVYNDKKSRETCQHYPNLDFKDYQQCDKSYIRLDCPHYDMMVYIESRKVLDEEGLVNVTPIWATDRLEEVTETQHTEKIYFKISRDVIFPLAAGLTHCDSCTPCRRVFTSSKLVSRSQGDGLSVLIYFDQTVKIRTIRSKEFNFFKVLSFLGSNMGLYLGLGVLQFLQMIFTQYKQILQMTKLFQK